MPIKRLKAVDTGTGYQFSVLLDDTKMIPDPAYVRTWTYGKVDSKGKPVSAKAAWAACEVEAAAEAAVVAQAGKELQL